MTRGHRITLSDAELGVVVDALDLHRAKMHDAAMNLAKNESNIDEIAGGIDRLRGVTAVHQRLASQRANGPQAAPSGEAAS